MGEQTERPRTFVNANDYDELTIEQLAAMDNDYHRVSIDPTARISPAASIVGSVTIGRNVTVLAGAHIRGDFGVPIEIGDEANLQEGVLVHVDHKFPVSIGARTSIGHGAIIHGCTIERAALIGMGAIVMNGAIVGEHAVVGAGALVTQGTVIPPRHLAIGSPARVVRELSDEEIEELCENGADFYLVTSEGMAKSGVLSHPDETTRIWPPSIAR